MKLIDKDALVAEIDRKIKINKECMLGLKNLDYYQGKVDALNDTISCLNTLEVKDVDLDKEIEERVVYMPMSEFTHSSEIDDNWDWARKEFRHFFELGMRVNNPITAADRGTAEEIIINLKRVEQDYRINLTKEITWVRNKSQKGGNNA